MITYQQEFLSSVQVEADLLTREEYDEVITKEALPLNIDWQLCSLLEQQGSMLIFTARASGVLVGYVVCASGSSPLSKGKKVGEVQALFLSKSYRKGLAGYKLIKFALECLIEDGHDYITVLAMDDKIEPLMSRLGLEKVEIKFGALV